MSTRTITELHCTSVWRDVGIAFALWKAEQDGVIAVGASPDEARAKLIAKLADPEKHQLPPCDHARRSPERAAELYQEAVRKRPTSR
jgi:hypothetical protein